MSEDGLRLASVPAPERSTPERPTAERPAASADDKRPLRLATALSTLLHGAVIALLLLGLPSAGGTLTVGNGGQGAIELVVAAPGDATASDGSGPSEPTTPPVEAAVEMGVEMAVAVDVVPAPSPPPPDAPTADSAQDWSEHLPPAPAPPPTAAVAPEPLPAPPPTAAVAPEPLPAPPPAAAVVPEPLPAPPPTASAAEDWSQAVAPQPVTRETAADPPPQPQTAAVPTADVAEDWSANVKAVPPPAEAAAESAAPPQPPEKPERAVELPAPAEPARKATAAKATAAESTSAATQAQSAAAAPGQPMDSADLAAAPGSATLGMTPGELQDYAGLVAAWLERHKRYPDRARRMRQQGVVTVEFAIDGQGRVISQRVVDATGFELLDGEATALLERANPLPAPPDGKARSFTMPVVFVLR